MNNIRAAERRLRRVSSLFPGNDARVEGGTRVEKCGFTEGSPGRLGVRGGRVGSNSVHDHHRHADVTVAEDITNRRLSKVTPRIEKREGTEEELEVTFMIFVTWRRPLRREIGAAGPVLVTRFTEFLTVFKNSECKTPAIKSLKIAYVSGLTKRGKSRNLDKAIFTSS